MGSGAGYQYVGRSSVSGTVKASAGRSDPVKDVQRTVSTVDNVDLRCAIRSDL
jgi:hypothetical protein